MLQVIKSLLMSLPAVRRLVCERDSLRSERDKLRSDSFFAPGHFYSAIPNVDEVRRDEKRVFDRSLHELPGVDLNVEAQIDLLESLKHFYHEQPFSDEPCKDRRYFFANQYFSYSDAIFLYCMIRFAKPKRIIEIGSGFSSFVMLDTNELFFDDTIGITFIEPYDGRLRSRLKDKDLRSCEIIRTRLQDVALARFDELRENDILFIDSSHVAKIGSDVNCIVFEILPRLARGVFVHFHDMFYPFEYPKEWIEEGRFWNEDYLVRAFLQFNSTFKVRIWNQFLASFHPEQLAKSMPFCMKNTGASLWLQRV